MSSARVYGSWISNVNSVESCVQLDCANQPDVDFLFLRFPAHSLAISSCQHMQTPRCWVQAKKKQKNTPFLPVGFPPLPSCRMASALVLFSQQQVCSFRLSKTFLKKERKKKRVRSKPAEGLWELLQPAWLCICRLVSGSSKILKKALQLSSETNSLPESFSCASLP